MVEMQKPLFTSEDLQNCPRSTISIPRDDSSPEEALSSARSTNPQEDALEWFGRGQLM